ncbi:hypothetical protein CAOG_00509 [Capsaspora owczarzaki ATCC 30864]|uniref:RWD domain-containing protein n=1 Tax=Capsaspora owczarzaki (strain ATCC 30864) TaxID=595528 RepID=A0A0D2U140_CAPO3|nr:hypothetical protein CAOG_00509 [Capsaspora owczarzaki ATCC 30864]KJE88941.1 hypothetical protein CAOG_000509 [Capsaspora owczarzaki ATCC 30864]|eukprot:XP_004365380.2 hypothetical protein CAOG_00509 [Capsaspora owczarzaki ATCC 30864]
MADEESYESELDLLQAMYYDESLIVSPDNPRELSALIAPRTAHDEKQQFVRCTLGILVPPKYPHELPAISISKPRGLSEAQVHDLLAVLRAHCTANKGQLMLYQLIELACERLTTNNMPTGACPVCLDEFDQDSLARTECFHAFHTHCFESYLAARHERRQELSREVINHWEKVPELLQVDDVSQTQCPVCRERIPVPPQVDTSIQPKLRSAAIETEEPIVFVPSPELRAQQAQMAILFERQKSQNGIIDRDAKRKERHIGTRIPVPQSDRDDSNRDSSSTSSSSPSPAVEAIPEVVSTSPAAEVEETKTGEDSTETGNEPFPFENPKYGKKNRNSKPAVQSAGPSESEEADTTAVDTKVSLSTPVSKPKHKNHRNKR